MVKKKSVKKVPNKDVVRKKGHKVIKTKKSLCYNCGNEIEELCKQVLLTTSDKGKIVQEVGFHYECWQEYFNKCVTKKAKEDVARVQKKIIGLMDNPIIKGLLSQVKGTDNLFSMLQMPLVTEDVVEKVKEKINDDRKRETKPRKRTAKTQMH